MSRLIEALKAPIRRHWPQMRLRTILLVTFLLVAALPGVGALFLRVYENTLVRQTEAELSAQSTALAATASALWPGSTGVSTALPHESGYNPYALVSGPLSTIDLSASPVLPERPAAVAIPGAPPADESAAAARLAPILRATADTTLASIVLLDPQGRILTGPDAGRGYPALPELTAALAGRPVTMLRRNGAYRQHYLLEWLSRASDLRLHHARPVTVNGKVVAVLLLSRSPRALFRGLYEDRGKILFGIGAIFATLVLLSGLLSRGIVRPIEALSDATRLVARGGSGDLPEAPETAAIEIRALYADFATMAEAIERRSRYLRDFAHAVSHEFKTPLAGITGAIELLQDHPEMAEADRQRFLANIDSDAARLALLVRRLLDLARADMAGLEPGTRADLGVALRTVTDANASADFTVQLDLGAEPLEAAMPGAMIEAVVGSLIENSRQAGARSVMIAAKADGAMWQVTLRDDGPGIPPGDRDRIFEPFFTSRRTTGGTGLGLPITRSLLASQGGGIDLLAADGGAVFVLRMPRVG